jgi:hypothetical protein
MNPQAALRSISSDDYAMRVCASSARAVRSLIRESEEFAAMRAGLQTNELTESAIEQFANGLMVGFNAGSKFHAIYALCVIAVLLERYSSRFAEEYLSGLNSSKLAEFGVAPYVARECLRVRSKSLPMVVETAPQIFNEKPLAQFVRGPAHVQSMHYFHGGTKTEWLIVNNTSKAFIEKFSVS